MKSMFPTYVLQSLQGHLSVVHDFIFALKIYFALLIPLGINSHSFGAREVILSVLKETAVCLPLHN